MTVRAMRAGIAARALFAVLSAALAAALVAVLAGCGSSEAASGVAAPDSTNQPIPVVTPTNVWGDVVSQVGGQYVAVRSLVTDPSADPHSFEPSAQAQLAVSKAELIVRNGGGYDDWLTTLIDASGSVAPIVDAEQLFASGGATDPTDGTVNEHFWYDLPTVDAVAQRVAQELADLRPEQAGYFKANADAFTGKVAALTAKVLAIKAAHGGTGIAVTEPVPLYLTEAAGLVDRTPERFSKAIEDGTDVPPTVLNDTLALFTGHQVEALVYNAQTASPETETVLNAAKENAVAVVPVTETLPENTDYLSWMDGTITGSRRSAGPMNPEQLEKPTTMDGVPPGAGAAGAGLPPPPRPFLPFTPARPAWRSVTGCSGAGSTWTSRPASSWRSSGPTDRARPA